MVSDWSRSSVDGVKHDIELKPRLGNRHRDPPGEVILQDHMMIG